MRTQLLFAMAFLGGAAIARAQPVPGPAVPPGPDVTATGAPPLATGDGSANVYPQLSTYYSNLAATLKHFPSVPATPPPAAYKPPPYWVGAGYTLGWIGKDKLPQPVVTSGEVGGPGPVGSIGDPSTRSLFGPDVRYDPFSGAFLEAGYFVCDDCSWSVEARGFVLFQNTARFDAASDAAGNPIITRPFFDVIAQQEVAALVSAPGALTGSVRVRSEASLGGVEFNARTYSSYAYAFRADWLFGFRYLHFQERLTVTDQFTPFPNNPVPFNNPANLISAPNMLQDQDQFRGSNDFFGGQVGLRLGWAESWYFGGLFGKVAMGVTKQRGEVQGSTTLLPPGGNNQTALGGILAVASNIGSRDRTRFGVVPEVGVNLGAFITDNIRFTVSYSVLMWSAVTRPGDLIDRGVSPGQIPTSAAFGQVPSNNRPLPLFGDSFFHAQLLNLGLEFAF